MTKRYLAQVAIITALAIASVLTLSDARGAQVDPRLQREELYHRINLGIAYLEQFKPEEAAKQFRQAVEKDPAFGLGHLDLAIAYYFSRESAKAQDEAQLAIRSLPDSPNAHYILGLCHKNDRRYDDAVRAFNTVLAIDPRDPATNIQLGQVYLQEQKYEPAATAFRKALEAEPYNATAAYNLAQTLQRAGKAAEGREAFQLFGRLRASNYKSEIGLNYGDVGRYAEAVAGTGAEADLVSNAPPVLKFVDATREMNLSAKFAPGSLSRWIGRKISRAEFEKVRPEMVAAFSTSVGACDYDGDGRFDILATGITSDGRPIATLFHNEGGKFSDVTAQSKITLARPAGGAVFGDFDNDGRQDILFFGYQLLTLYRNNGDGSFTDVTEAWSLPPNNNGGWAMTAAMVDCDHDGDLDLFIGNFAEIGQFPDGRTEAVFPDDFAGTANRLFRNNGENKGKGSFSDLTEQAGLGGGPNKTVAVVCTDYDNHRDIDFLVVNYNAPLQLFANQRDGAFREIARQVMQNVPAPKGFGVAAGDLNKDGFTDFVVSDSGADGTPVMSDGKSGFAVADARGGGPAPLALQALDFDNDGLIDRIESRADGIRILRTTGKKGETAAGPAIPVNIDSRALAVADLDGDGSVDVLTVNSGGSLVAMKNQGAAGNFAVIGIKGLSSNRNAIGTKVTLRSGSLSQKLELYAASPAPSAAGLNFGLGYRTAVDSLQLLWPSGIMQSELEIKAGRRNTYDELDRKGTSCPILYAWNGSEFSFVTDFLGGCAIGMREPGNNWSIPDTDEYVRVTGEQLRPRDGRLSILMNNQLEEVIFFDAVKLLAVDHPASTDIYPNEKLMPGPPYTPFHIYSVSSPRPPVIARDDRGNDIRPQLERLDHIYPVGFKKLKFKGYAEEHAIELDLGPGVLKAKHPLLLLSAWIDYADSSSNLAASQAGVTITPPYLQVRNERGDWETVIPQMGFPAGLTKTMTVDLTGKFLTRDSRVRIVTSMCIYWDQALVDLGQADAAVKVTVLEPVTADLHWRGFPKEISLDSFGLKAYDYAYIDAIAPWKAHLGNYTRYGDVRELLLRAEDMYVITRNGDEMQVDFDARRLPPLPTGWKRDYLVYADGFGKDMDLNSGRPETVGELPFHGMRSYPHAKGEGYPTDSRHLDYLRRYNTRSVGVQTQAMWRGTR